MNHISLFSGMGGFDLAAQWMGWNNIAHCEKDEFCQKILKYYWPNAKIHKDVKEEDFSEWEGKCDILSMGPPCQPYSHVGKQRGDKDPRHLWPHGFRAAKQIKPKRIVFENVRGLVDWNDGLVFDEILSDLEAEGYENFPILLPAASLGFLHKRHRIWIVAIKRDAFNSNSNSKRPYREKIDIKGSIKLQHKQVSQFGQVVSESIQSGTDPTIFPLVDGLSSRLDGITFPRFRRESIKAAGNAIVPQVAYNIFRAIEQYSLSTPD